MPPLRGVPDGYVRLALSELHTVTIQHVVSAIDLSIASPEGAGPETPIDMLTGFTEWIGAWRSATITVGWDWGVANDQIIVLNPDELRCNLQIVDRDGLPESAARSRTMIWNWIESQPWRLPIERVIHEAS